MPHEISFDPTDDDATITLDDLLGRLDAAGLPCRLDPEGDGMAWVELGDHESTFLASIRAGRLAFATFRFSWEDDPSFFDTIHDLLTRAGYSAGEDEGD